MKTILAGLPEAKDFWAYMNLLRYLFLLSGMDAASGLYTANVVERCETFTLPRSGYARWYHRAMLGNAAALCLPLAAITGIACLTSGDSVQTVGIASAILALNLLVVANLQMFITLISRNTALGYLACMLIQLISIFCSERFPPVGKMALIGNWGMLARSTLVQPDGISIGTAVAAEIAILLMLWLFAWRAIRKNRRVQHCANRGECVQCRNPTASLPVLPAYSPALTQGCKRGLICDSSKQCNKRVQDPARFE